MVIGEVAGLKSGELVMAGISGGDCRLWQKHLGTRCLTGATVTIHNCTLASATLDVNQTMSRV